MLCNFYFWCCNDYTAKRKLIKSEKQIYKFGVELNLDNTTFLLPRGKLSAIVGDIKIPQIIASPVKEMILVFDT